MAPNDPFSFLEDSEASDDDESMDGEEANIPGANHAENGAPTPELKRKAVDAEELRNDAGQSRNGSEENDEQPPTKRARPAWPAPVVVDEFETEAKREVAASAGLTGSVEAGSRLELRHQVRHQVAVPPGYNYVPISKHVPPAKPAREYKFTLDPFQQVSVHAIQRNESVLVSAHTSAGKTVVAEYAIAQCLENKQRVIYTSPIKVRQ